MKFSPKLVLPLTLSSVLAMQLGSAHAGEVEAKAEQAARQTEQSFESAEDEGSEAWQESKEGAEEVWDETEEAGGDAWAATEETSEEVWQETKETTSAAWESTQDAFNEGVLAGRLETALILNDQLNPFEIDFEIKGDDVVLTGAVDSEVDKKLATDIAGGVEGIDQVDNRLSVSATPGGTALRQQAQSDERQPAELSEQDRDADRDFSQYVSDVSTTAAIKAELLANDQVDGMDINVDTFRDEVTLSGEVDSEAQKTLAEDIVKQRDGVAKVINRLTVAAKQAAL